MPNSWYRIWREARVRRTASQKLDRVTSVASTLAHTERFTEGSTGPVCWTPPIPLSSISAAGQQSTNFGWCELGKWVGKRKNELAPRTNLYIFQPPMCHCLFRSFSTYGVSGEKQNRGTDPFWQVLVSADPAPIRELSLALTVVYLLIVFWQHVFLVFYVFDSASLEWVELPEPVVVVNKHRLVALGNCILFICRAQCYHGRRAALFAY